MFGLSKVNNSVDGLSNTIETPHAHIKCFNDAFAAYAADADNNGIYCVKPFHHPGVRTVVISGDTGGRAFKVCFIDTMVSNANSGKKWCVWLLVECPFKETYENFRATIPPLIGNDFQCLIDGEKKLHRVWYWEQHNKKKLQQCKLPVKHVWNFAHLYDSPSSFYIPEQTTDCRSGVGVGCFLLHSLITLKVISGTFDWHSLDILCSFLSQSIHIVNFVSLCNDLRITFTVVEVSQFFGQSLYIGRSVNRKVPPLLNWNRQVLRGILTGDMQFVYSLLGHSADFLHAVFRCIYCTYNWSTGDPGEMQHILDFSELACTHKKDKTDALLNYDILHEPLVQIPLWQVVTFFLHGRLMLSVAK